jgi:hypothetical protein
MDDIIVLSPTRWKLRKAIKTVNRHFEKLKLKQHPDKTTIGRITNGFDFFRLSVWARKNNSINKNITKSHT